MRTFVSVALLTVLVGAKRVKQADIDVHEPANRPTLSSPAEAAVKQINDAFRGSQCWDLFVDKADQPESENPNGFPGKTKYKKLTRFVHPDKSSHEDAKAAFQLLNNINECFEKAEVLMEGDKDVCDCFYPAPTARHAQPAASTRHTQQRPASRQTQGARQWQQPAPAPAPAKPSASTYDPFGSFFDDADTEYARPHNMQYAKAQYFDEDTPYARRGDGYRSRDGPDEPMPGRGGGYRSRDDQRADQPMPGGYGPRDDGYGPRDDQRADQPMPGRGGGYGPRDDQRADQPMPGHGPADGWGEKMHNFFKKF